MGSKTDGFPIKHIKSKCCFESFIRFTTNGNQVLAWCDKCGKYYHNRNIQGLIALYMGDFEAVKSWNGFLPKWLSELIIAKDFLTDENSHMKEVLAENKELKEDISKYMNALENSSNNIKDIAKANGLIAKENLELLRKYKFKIPFPDCCEGTQGNCGNGIVSAGMKHICQTISCQSCKNRNISKLEELIKND